MQAPATYVTMLGLITRDLEDINYHTSKFQILDTSSGLHFECIAEDQLVHHIRHGEKYMFYGKIDKHPNDNNITFYMVVESVHEYDEPEPESDSFELIGAL